MPFRTMSCLLGGDSMACQSVCWKEMFSSIVGVDSLTGEFYSRWR